MNSTVSLPSHYGETEAKWPVDTTRGINGMYTVIATEFSLFVCLFASYYYLGNNKDRWAADRPPDMRLAVIMLAVLLSSSAVLEWGERQIQAARYGAARVAILFTVAIGLAFLALQTVEYKQHWRTLTPYSDSYGSIFYTITSFHAAHVAVGILLLAYVAALPTYRPGAAPPHRPYRTVALYWHFVDFVWIFIVLLLYAIPNLQAR